VHLAEPARDWGAITSATGLWSIWVIPGKRGGGRLEGVGADAEGLGAGCGVRAIRIDDAC